LEVGFAVLRYLQTFIKKIAAQRGYRATIEEPIQVMVACSSWKSQAKVKSVSFGIKINENSHIGLHIKKRRLELNMLQQDVAKIIGVCTDSIRGWENGRGIPQLNRLPKIIEFLGFNSYVLENPKNLSEQIKGYRLRKGLSFKQTGLILNVDASTVMAWEKGNALPKLHNLKKINLLLSK